jgi:hypothetical protein
MTVDNLTIFAVVVSVVLAVMMIRPPVNNRILEKAGEV